VKQIVFCLGMLLATSLAHARELIVTVNGKEVRLKTTIMNREIGVKDRNSGDRQSAVGCSLLFHSLLAANDIEKASRLTTDPRKTAEMWTHYRERVGGEEFRKSMVEYFTGKYVIVAEIVKDATHMLVVQPPGERAGAQMYLEQKDGFVRVDPPVSEDAKVLGKVLTMIQDGTVKLQ
jgi:hypothetical protein